MLMTTLVSTGTLQIVPLILGDQLFGIIVTFLNNIRLHTNRLF